MIFWNNWTLLTMVTYGSLSQQSQGIHAPLGLWIIRPEMVRNFLILITQPRTNEGRVTAWSRSSVRSEVFVCLSLLVRRAQRFCARFNVNKSEESTVNGLWISDWSWNYSFFALVLGPLTDRLRYVNPWKWIRIIERSLTSCNPSSPKHALI